MALMACGECRKEVSDKAVSCPHCGAPINQMAAIPVKPQKDKNVGCGTLIVVVVVGIIVAQCVAKVNESSSPAVSSGTAIEAPARTAAQEWDRIQARWSPEEDPSEKHAAIVRELERMVTTFPNTPEAKSAAELLPTAREKADAYVATANARVSERKWHYDSNVDPMTSAKRVFAAIDSENTIELDFPYQGAQHGKLMIRRTGSELDAFFSIREGQLQCGYNECFVDVRFDEEPPTKFRMAEAADNSTEILFFTDPQRLLSKIEGAKTVRVQVVIFHGGAHTFEFDVSGFRPELMNR
jgi:hypothetical protein